MTRAATLALAVLLLAPSAGAKDTTSLPVETRAAQEGALQQLRDGNVRYVEGKQAAPDRGDARRKELTKGQHPRAAILSCSDSRVPPEYVFDQQLGEVFVVRTAGNVADEVALGSIEYAVEHLGVPVVVVLGHRSCGAVKATVEAHARHETVHGNIGAVVKLVEPAVVQAEQAKAADLMNASIDLNASMEAKALVSRSPVIADMVKEGRVRIVTAIYALESGKVTFAD